MSFWKPKSTASHRQAWERAVEKGSSKDAVAALEAIERSEPRDPRWPHRAGDAYRRLGRTAQAEAAYQRAMVLYEAQGFTARAVAMAKLITGLNPGRAALLDAVDNDAARSLRSGLHGHDASATSAPVEHARGSLSSIPPASAVKIAARGAASSPSLPPSPVSGSFRAVASAAPLLRASDAGLDEVRFEDARDDEHSVEIEIAEVDRASWLPDDGADPAQFDFVETPTAARLSLMSGAPLLADVPREAVPELAKASDLVELAAGALVYRADSPADSLYLIVEGAVVELSGSVRDETGAEIVTGIPLEHGSHRGEGEIFGEECLLEASARATDVQAVTPLLALRIPKVRLDRIVADHAAVGSALFSLLVNRLVSTLVQTSGLFTGFDATTRREIAALFEVRRAAVGTVLREAGKRSDGLYVLLSGRVQILREGGAVTVPLGATLGHDSLLGSAVEQETVRVVGEAVLLRLPASRFGLFASRYPPALAHLVGLGS